MLRDLITQSSETFKGSSTELEVLWYQVFRNLIYFSRNKNMTDQKRNMSLKYFFHRKYIYARIICLLNVNIWSFQMLNTNIC